MAAVQRVDISDDVPDGPRSCKVSKATAQWRGAWHSMASCTHLEPLSGQVWVTESCDQFPTAHPLARLGDTLFVG